MDNLLEKIKERMRARVSELNYRTWIAPLAKAEVQEEYFLLHVPNKFVADWLSDYYKEALSEEISGLTNKNLTVAFTVTDATSVAIPSNIPVIRPRAIGGLNENYSFDKFVVGSSNQFAHAASKAVADLPGGRYNPFFIYGGVGLGKTHLLHAIGLSLREKHPHLKIVYINTERFVNEVISAIRYERTVELRQKYRDACDVLLIDDIQFICGKERTQDEFYHTFNALHESGRQIVVTSDKPPKDMANIEERLRSRFEWGLIADIQPPDLETRVAIVKKKAEAAGFDCPDDVAMLLASAIKSNVRELEGSLIKVHSMSKLTGAVLTADFVRGVLKDALTRNEAGPSIEKIQKAVAGYFKISIADLKSPRRLKSIAYPRQIAMYLCKKHAHLSFPEIGSKFGGKDHTTVIHAFRKIEGLLKTDPRLQDDMIAIERAFLG